MQAKAWQLHASTAVTPTLAPAAALQLVATKTILQLEVNDRITEALLTQHLEALGFTKRHHVQTLVCLRGEGRRGRQGPNALVQFFTEGDAARALPLLHGSTLCGLELQAKHGSVESFIFTGKWCLTASAHGCHFMCLQLIG